jgi:hypothetical protein
MNFFNFNDFIFTQNDVAPNFWKYSNANPKVKTVEK